MWQRTKSKYRNVITEIDGVKFHSAREAKRYTELKLLQNAGEIRELELQPRFELIVKDTKICTYIADFRYYEVKKKCDVVEDVKGFVTDVAKLKMKLFCALYPFFDFRIIK